MTTVCERLATAAMMNEAPEDTAMLVMLKGTDDMQKDDDKRLTPVQRDIRDRNANLPKHVRRSIDRYRQSLGMVPLWGSSLERNSRRP